MSIELPRPGALNIPAVPTEESLRNMRHLKEYLETMRRVLVLSAQGLFDNDLALATAINSGTSGTFTISSGGSIVVTSGIVITVTS